MNVIKFANANNKALLAGYQDTGLFIYLFFDGDFNSIHQKLQDQP